MLSRHFHSELPSIKWFVFKNLGYCIPKCKVFREESTFFFRKNSEESFCFARNEDFLFLIRTIVQKHDGFF